jgi:hypothetical protein
MCERESMEEIYTQENGKHFGFWNAWDHIFFDKKAENEEKEINGSSLFSDLSSLFNERI